MQTLKNLQGLQQSAIEVELKLQKSTQVVNTDSSPFKSLNPFASEAKQGQLESVKFLEKLTKKTIAELSHFCLQMESYQRKLKGLTDNFTADQNKLVQDIFRKELKENSCDLNMGEVYSLGCTA